MLEASLALGSNQAIDTWILHIIDDRTPTYLAKEVRGVNTIVPFNFDVIIN
jgi:hypothetical protein